ncbi:universal stress protein UspA (plasmid) [Sphingomonas panacis]|uniref:Universal stress protein UspA n=1 Tax=Sphingomonas panacis TaxID=1560345 RepID=A0A1B3ZI09_9SPHN|nr:universal stress protein [Sphingomonas panacis]AOH87067.1 universal stress protein UspA [Sphingomonas panacis]
MLKDILAIVDTGDADEQFLKDAREFARFHDAHLSIAILSAVPTADYALAFGPPYVLLTDYVEAAGEKQAEVARIAEREGYEVRILSDETGVLLDKAPVQARYADLILFGPVSAYANPHLRKRLFENVALSSGRPVLILPAQWRPRAFAHIAIGWNATREATRALGDGLSLAASGAEVDVIVVDAKPTTKGHGSEPGADIARNIARHGFAVTVHTIPSEGGSDAAILADFARTHRADLLVLGASGHSRLRELFLGGVTHELLDGGPVPILFGS